jgi:hypothetical protein
MFTAKKTQKLLPMIVAALLGLAGLNLLIWFNPYGRSISSSFPALFLLPVLGGIFAFILYRPSEITRLWATHKNFSRAVVVLALFLLTLLGLAEQSTLYTLVTFTMLLALVMLVGSQPRPSLLLTLSLLSLAACLLNSGLLGIPSSHSGAWFWDAYRIIVPLAATLSTLFAAAWVSTTLRNSAAEQGWHFGFTSLMTIVMLVGGAYSVYWDGIWSAAHARAFEDHLPFVTFLISLGAGVWLSLAHSGARRLAGPAFLFAATLIAVLALTWGWNVSAFELTNQRAAQVDQAIVRYYQETGSYPHDLGELTPRFLLYLPPPVVVRQGGWCYQGGQAGFRLGYISGNFTYFGAHFRIDTYAQAGEIPIENSECEQLIKLFEDEKQMAY